MKKLVSQAVQFKASDCGNSFQVEYFDGIYKYQYVAGKYYAQRLTPILKPVVEISQSGFIQACQYLKDNISLCGSNFTVPFENFTIKYWFDGTNFYKQTVGDFVKNLPVKIKKEEFINACNSRF